MSNRTTGRMPRKYTQGIYKDKREIDKYRKLASRILSESKTYEKESMLAVIGIVVCVVMLSLTPFVILFKKKHSSNNNGNSDSSLSSSSNMNVSTSVNPIVSDVNII